jgi:hypothetical protein
MPRTPVFSVSTLVCVTAGVHLVSLCQHLVILGIRGDSASALGYIFPRALLVAFLGLYCCLCT